MVIVMTTVGLNVHAMLIHMQALCFDLQTAGGQYSPSYKENPQAKDQQQIAVSLPPMPLDVI